ncbi:galactose mutarotase-like domain-containing protein [Mycena floridula]|nr:galactose mutarotase-like domain-containing protein [Mycena floridula]
MCMQLLADQLHPKFHSHLKGPSSYWTQCLPYSLMTMMGLSLPFHAAHHLQKSQQQSLTGGIIGWDRRNWTVIEKTSAGVVYSHFDPAEEGFPGNVTVYAHFHVSTGGTFNSRIHATATEKTPIMVTQHIYWNLDAFQDGSTDVLNHNLPVNAMKTRPMISPMVRSWGLYETSRILLTIISSTIGKGKLEPHSGVTSLVFGLITSNQPAVQVFAASFFDLVNITRKAIHGGPGAFYKAWSAVAIQEGYVSAIKVPEWPNGTLMRFTILEETMIEIQHIVSLS